MTERSKPKPSGTPPSRSVALWKDAVDGIQELRFEGRRGGLLLNISAEWREEFTADGRGDRLASAVFRLNGHERLDTSSVPELIDVNPLEEKYESSSARDLLELTMFSFLADACLESPRSLLKEFEHWATGSTCAEPSDFIFLPRVSLEHLVFKPMQEKRMSSDYVGVIRWLIDNLKPLADNLPRMEHWEALVNRACLILENVSQESHERNYLGVEDRLKRDSSIRRSEKVRLQILTALEILWAVHKRLAFGRRKGGLSNAGDFLLEKIETSLGSRYDKYWFNARRSDD